MNRKNDSIQVQFFKFGFSDVEPTIMATQFSNRFLNYRPLFALNFDLWGESLQANELAKILACQVTNPAQNKSCFRIKIFIMAQTHQPEHYDSALTV